MMDYFRQFLLDVFLGFGFAISPAQQLTLWCLVLLLVFTCLLVGYVCHKLLTPVILHIVRKTETEIDDYFFNRPVLHALWQVLPGLLFFILLPYVFTSVTPERTAGILFGAAQIYITITLVRLVVTFLNNLSTFASENERFKDHHLIGIIQFLKLVCYFVGTIVVVAFLLGRNPGGLIAGLGAAATVLMFVFKDSVLGLVAGIQLSINKMLKPGDWIKLEKWGINGIVEAVTLTTVKVRNFDNTISTIPPYTLVSESFQNWTAMQELGARRVKRALFIDIGSIALVEPDDVMALKEKKLLADVDVGIETGVTNLTLFRHYAEQYLATRPDVMHDDANRLWVMARQLDPTPNGLPIEFWYYLTETGFPRYEDAVAEIMEYFIAIAPTYGLRLYQTPTGRDFGIALRQPTNDYQ